MCGVALYDVRLETLENIGDYLLLMCVPTLDLH